MSAMSSAKATAVAITAATSPRLRRNWGGEFENVAILVAIAINEDGYREVLGAAEGMKEDKTSWVTSAANVEAFIEKAKRYTTIEELTPELLRLFIQRIEVGERSQKYSRSAGQSVRIVYRDIGRVDSPMQEGEHTPNITKQITDIEEINRLLA